MKITVKKKVLAGAISVGLLSGVGMAFANTDAGGALKTWYAGQFGATLDKIDADVMAHAAGQLPGLQDEYDGMKSDAEGDINSARDTGISTATGEISKAKASHIASVEKTKEEIIEGAGLAFYNEFLRVHFEIERIGDEALTNATNNLTAFTGQKGTEALAQVTSELTTAKEAAVSELEEAIKKAQGDLIAELAKQEEINTRNLKNRVNWKIEEVREEIYEILNGLVTTQEGLIAAKAAELQADAIAALDDVISSINE